MFARDRTTVILAIHAETTGEQAWPCRNPLRFIGKSHGPEQHAIGPIGPIGDHVHAVVDAVTDIDIKAPWRTKQGFVLGCPPPITVTSGVVLGIRLCFHNHAPKQGAVVLAFHKAAPHQVRTHLLCGAAEERERQWMQLITGYLTGFNSLKQHPREGMQILHTLFAIQ